MFSFTDHNQLFMLVTYLSYTYYITFLFRLDWIWRVNKDMETHINTKVPQLNTLFFVRMVIEENGADGEFQLHVTGGGSFEVYLDVNILTGLDIPAFQVPILLLHRSITRFLLDFLFSFGSTLHLFLLH